MLCLSSTNTSTCTQASLFALALDAFLVLTKSLSAQSLNTTRGASKANARRGPYYWAEMAKEMLHKWLEDCGEFQHFHTFILLNRWERSSPCTITRGMMVALELSAKKRQWMGIACVGGGVVCRAICFVIVSWERLCSVSQCPSPETNEQITYTSTTT